MQRVEGEAVKPVHIGIAFPCRGMSHTRTIAGILREVAPYSHSWHFAIGLSIPMSHNTAALDALTDPRTTHVWMCESDHLYPVGALEAMLAADAPVAAIGYLLRSGMPCVMRDAAGEVVLVGLGCTLIRRDVFSDLPDPPFEVGNRLQWEGGQWRDSGVPEYSGGHDVRFSIAVRAAGHRITVLDGWQAGHLEVTRPGGRTNAGWDEIRCWGGDPLMPWYPQERPMAQEWWKSPSGHTVLDLDPEKGADIGFYERQGWVRINKTDATPLLKTQLARNAEQVKRESEEDDD